MASFPVYASNSNSSSPSPTRKANTYMCCVSNRKYSGCSRRQIVVMLTLEVLNKKYLVTWTLEGLGGVNWSPPLYFGHNSSDWHNIWHIWALFVHSIKQNHVLFNSGFYGNHRYIYLQYSVLFWWKVAIFKSTHKLHVSLWWYYQWWHHIISVIRWVNKQRTVEPKHFKIGQVAEYKNKKIEGVGVSI